MNLYMIRRRKNWRTVQELEAAAARSTKVGNEEMADKVRWIRTYVVQEEDGTLGSICIYQGVDAQAIREHAKRTGISADEVLPVPNTVVVRPDPEG